MDTTPTPVDVVDQHRARVVGNASERCDAEATNPAKAWVFAEFPDGRTVSYCAHHGRRFMDGLIAAGATVIDYSDHVLA